MPYQVNRDTFAVARYFVWQDVKHQPVYHHQVMHDFYLDREMPPSLEARSLGGFFIAALIKLGRLWLFYIGPALTIPLFFLPWIFRDRRIKWLLIAGAVSLVGSALIVFFMAHYAAPMAAVIIAVVVQGMRHMRVCRYEGKATGLFLVRALVVVCVLIVPLEVRTLATPASQGTWESLGTARAKVLAQLDALPDRQLVLVRYKPQHDTMAEWVYNRANIDSSKVVWAREMSAADNEELFRYFEDRHVWLLEADETPPKLTTYLPAAERERTPAALPQQ